MATGKIKWYNPKKGFGFITGEGKDVFVHYTRVVSGDDGELKEGDTVEFEIEPGEIGPRAAKVTKKPITPSFSD